MTYEDAVFRARLAYGQPGLTKQAKPFDPEDPEIKQLTATGPAEAQWRASEIANRAAGEAQTTERKESDAVADAALKAKADAAKATQDAVNKGRQDLGITLGAGALGGLAAGGAAYGLAGLFPSLRKRRLLRALIALGAGGAAGVGTGYYVNKGLADGSLQNMYAGAKERIGNAYNSAANALRGGAKS